MSNDTPTITPPSKREWEKRQLNDVKRKFIVSDGYTLLQTVIKEGDSKTALLLLKTMSPKKIVEVNTSTNRTALFYAIRNMRDGEVWCEIVKIIWEAHLKKMKSFEKRDISGRSLLEYVLREYYLYEPFDAPSLTIIYRKRQTLLTMIRRTIVQGHSQGMSLHKIGIQWSRDLRDNLILEKYVFNLLENSLSDIRELVYSMARV